MTPPTPECNVEVRPSAIAGNGLFATKDIPAGSTILLKARPLIGELDLSRSHDSCANCFLFSQKDVRACPIHKAEADRLGRYPGCSGCQSEGEALTVKACTGCKKVKYCSKVCQKQAWTRYHKRECKILRDPSLPPLPSSVRAALQLACLMDSDAVSEEDKAGVRRLEAHSSSTIEQFREVMQYEVTVAAARDLFARISPDDDDAQKMRDYVGKILRNSLTLTLPTLEPMGVALDPIVCSANHSCEPNASVLFDQPRLMMRSLSPIKKDQEIFISYIDNTDPFYRRQAQLTIRYCFECQCSKCQFGTNGREDHWTQSLENLEAKWADLAELMDSQKGYSSVPANFLGESKAEWNMSVIQGDVYASYEPIHNQKDNKLATEAFENVMRTCKQTGMWPITRQPYANMRVDIASRLIADNHLALAMYHMAKAYFLIDPILYPQDFHPVRVVHTWNLVKTLVQAYSSPQDPRETVDPGVQELFRLEFDFVVPIWRLLKKLSVDVLKSHGSGSNLTVMVHALTQQVRDGVGMQNLVEIERDPLGMWEKFKDWAHHLDY
ncbi:SET domain-containing protein [Aureobasidium sp. EXF-10728]|nr:SET domain-containing protein [Aureobasidium sp. EXF-10728]